MPKIDVKKKILQKNSDNAQQLRNDTFQNTLVLNFVSSPGSGKTTILEKILPDLAKKYKTAVIEGDLQTENDAERIRKTGVHAVQVNTGGACHLEAGDIKKALEKIEDGVELLIIENVGNLVCPSAFDLGEDAKIVSLSVTEGDDKPAKYPTMFRAASAFVVNKIDLLPYVDFDVEQTIKYALEVNPELDCFTVSARTGEGLAEISAWIEKKISEKLGR